MKRQIAARNIGLRFASCSICHNYLMDGLGVSQALEIYAAIVSTGMGMNFFNLKDVGLVTQPDFLYVFLLFISIRHLRKPVLSLNRGNKAGTLLR